MRERAENNNRIILDLNDLPTNLDYIVYQLGRNYVAVDDSLVESFWQNSQCSDSLKRLIVNGGRGVYTAYSLEERIDFIETYLDSLDNQTPLILSGSPNEVRIWAKMFTRKNYKVNSFFTYNPRNKALSDQYVLSREPLRGYDIYLTDISGVDKLNKASLFTGDLLGSMPKTLVVDRFKKNSRLPRLNKGIWSTIFMDQNVFPKNHRTDVSLLIDMCWTDEQSDMIHYVDENFEQIGNSKEERMEILDELFRSVRLKVS